MVSINITIFIAFTGLLISSITFLIGQKNGVKKEGQEKGVLLTKIGSIEKTVEEIKKDVKEINVGQINEKINSIDDVLCLHSERLNILEKDYKRLLQNGQKNK